MPRCFPSGGEARELPSSGERRAAAGEHDLKPLPGTGL